jgi:hypothetical protein
MPRHRQNLEAKSQVCEVIAFGVAHGGGADRNARICRTDYWDRTPPEKFSDAADVVGVMVSQQDRG